MDKELKRLILEIVTLTLLLIIIIPICVNASNKYNEQKEVLLSGIGTSVDISHNGDMKKITIYSDYDKVVKVNLIMKISKFSNDYDIHLDDQIYNINDLEYSEDNNWRYYKLGIYEVNKVRDFDFKLRTKGSIYYKETIVYSFLTEGLL